MRQVPDQVVKVIPFLYHIIIPTLFYPWFNSILSVNQFKSFYSCGA